MLYWFAEFPLNLWSRLIVTVTQYLRSLSLGSKINLAPGLRGLRTSCREGMVEPLMSWWTASRERWFRKGQSKIQLQWFSFSWVPPIKASRICQNSATYQLGTSFPVGITFSKVIYKSRSSPGFSRNCLLWLYPYPPFFRLVPEPLQAWDVRGVCVYALTRACPHLCWLLLVNMLAWGLNPFYQ